MTTEAFDPTTIDCDAFFRELREIRREAEAELGEEDIRHVRRIERFGHIATAIGLATAWVPNPISMAGLALGRGTRWILMHHVGHRGYDRVPNVPPRFTSRVFASGKRRFLDWPDWMLPEAWKYEHNVLHHTHTGELRDPDLVERNTEWLREMNIPQPLKLAAMGVLAATWRPVYYAPSTVHAWLSRGRRPADGGEPEEVPPGYARTLWLRCYAPYTLINFVGLPALFLPLGPFAAMSALINSLGGEVLANLHTFAVIAPNHTGDDLYRFDAPAASKAEGAVRQVIGSVNYATGTELIDFAQLYLNYQIEHHVFPDLPMLRYRQVQPKVQALCAKYGVPYVQESVFSRVKQLLSVATGKSSMKRASRVGRPKHEPLSAAAE